MGENKGWFYLVKKLFISETEPKPEKKQKRWKWVFGRMKNKRLATLMAPLPPKVMTRRKEEEEVERMQALSVAMASTAAAEAAVAAAKAAVEVVWLRGSPQSNHQEVVDGAFKPQKKALPTDLLKREREIHEFAAIIIQTAFRGFLARKALRALKGIVKLQAIIRGRAVRRQAVATLKCLQSIVSIQSQVCSNRLHPSQNTFNSPETKQFQSLKDKIINLDSNGQRWDDSLLSKEEANAVFFSRKEAVIRRERVKEYLFTHRRSAESERKRVRGRWRYWLNQWVDTQLSKSKELEDLDSLFTSNLNHKETEEGYKPFPKTKTMDKTTLELHNQSPSQKSSLKKLSHHKKHPSLGGGNDINNSSFSSSPLMPTYMAATESAKAKARSLSSPKLRPAGGFDTCSDGNSPCKTKQLSLALSTTSEAAISNGRRGFQQQQQRSPGLKGLPGPTRSSRILVKDLSIDSDHSLPNWDRQSSFQ